MKMKPNKMYDSKPISDRVRFNIDEEISQMREETRLFENHKQGEVTMSDKGKYNISTTGMISIPVSKHEQIVAGYKSQITKLKNQHKLVVAGYKSHLTKKKNISVK